jgi:hypothetical protein
MIHYYGLHCKPNQNEQQLYPTLLVLLQLTSVFFPNFSMQNVQTVGLKLQTVLIHALCKNLGFKVIFIAVSN